MCPSVTLQAQPTLRPQPLRAAIVLPQQMEALA
jgi:hypothetical protein